MRADSPAREYFFADIERLRPWVYAFGEERADAFMEAVSCDERRHPVPSEWDTNRYQAIWLDVFALQELLADAAQQGDDAQLQRFIDGVNDRELLVGHVWARGGGDFVVTLALEEEEGTVWLKLIKTDLNRRRIGSSRVALAFGTDNAPAVEPEAPGIQPGAGGPRVRRTRQDTRRTGCSSRAR